MFSISFAHHIIDVHGRLLRHHGNKISNEDLNMFFMLLVAKINVFVKHTGTSVL